MNARAMLMLALPTFLPSSPLTTSKGVMTLVIGLASFPLMPAGPTQSANWARGKKGWFTER